MSNHDPVFIDQFNTGGKISGGSQVLIGLLNEGPVWKQSWNGETELWRVFWLYFIMGHGVLLAIGCGLMILCILVGLATNPNLIASGIAVVGVFIFVIVLIFYIWSFVAIWRCAGNCQIKAYGTSARVLMIGYVATLAIPMINYLSSG